MTQSYEPAMGRDELEQLLADFVPQFSSREALNASLASMQKFCRDKNMPMGRGFAFRWFERDAKQDAVLSYRLPTAGDMPLADNLPQQPQELSADQTRGYVRNGDEHNWYYRGGVDGPFDPAWVLVPYLEHERACPRCQLGAESRRKVDERAVQLHRKPFGNLGEALKRVHPHRDESPPVEVPDPAVAAQDDAAHAQFQQFWDAGMAERLPKKS
jgi:hypothetical protein